MAKITINGITLDPIAQAHALSAASLMAADAKASNYLLIQTKAPLDAAQKQELAGLGVKLLEYVPESTYIANYTPDDLAKIRALPYVAWANTYMRGFKRPETASSESRIASPSSRRTRMRWSSKSCESLNSASGVGCDDI